jgi:shikimate dehydrogenase
LERALPDLEVELQSWQGDYRVPADTDILINATSVGLYPNVDARLPLDLTDLAARTLVADVIFNPANTHLIRDARSRGCPVLDGLEMLVGQGVIGIEYWTGRRPSAAVMRGALEAVFTGS